MNKVNELSAHGCGGNTAAAGICTKYKSIYIYRHIHTTPHACETKNVYVRQRRRRRRQRQHARTLYRISVCAGALCACGMGYVSGRQAGPLPLPSCARKKLHACIQAYNITSTAHSIHSIAERGERAQAFRKRRIQQTQRAAVECVWIFPLAALWRRICVVYSVWWGM